ncbi:GNAT family N-acetyltransferase [Pseudofulvibacter geojedonensis]|uniref:GNAT family N-acetyltransferase n=1 Tax=Pseudofulvibacter geojedonensis TaxID=1123758 RepID=A0ABW3I1D8_9FLAO
MRIIETERIYLREFNSEDVAFLYRLNQDEDVMQYTGDAPFKNMKEAETFVANYDYEKYQMGRWAVCSNKQGEFLGWCGLKYHPDKDFVEVGYRFFKKHWNKGYATEATKACINYGFNVLRVQEIFAFANSLNIASCKVAEKAGMELLDEIIHEGNLTKQYKINNTTIQVKEISASETYPIRHEILRKGKSIESCYFNGDNLTSTFHIGLFYFGKLVAVATFLENKNSNFKDKIQFQLRGMAVLHQFQGKKLGNVLLREAERKIKTRNATLLWCNARERAKGFYTRNGFDVIGKPFDITEIGLHYCMYKIIEKEVHRFF